MASSEIELEFGDGQFLFRLPALYIDRLQRERGTDVTYPDGSQGKRPKPFGQIFREHMTGDYDPIDSLTVIKLALTAGASGVVAGETIKLDPTKARIMVEDVVKSWPVEQWYLFASAILRACCYGYEAKAEDSEPGNETPPQAGDTSTSEPPPETSPSSDKESTG